MCLLAAILCGGGQCAYAQSDSTATAVAPAKKPDFANLMRRAENLREAYDFAASRMLCDSAMNIAADSLQRHAAEEASLLAGNGISMLDYCYSPVVVARRRFSLKEFHLFYPLEDGAWRPTPNQLDSLGGGDFSPAVYIPENSTTIYYSAGDENGIRNIYRTSLRDSTWSVPRLLNESITSCSDEAFPMLSPDGKKLYFSSKGLYGVGGYDLYESTWDESIGDWGTPVNMGFPYSSPYDDFLYINTDDGKYSIFASNRDCPADSVCVYVLEYDSMPVRRQISDISAIRSLCALEPEDDPTRMDNNSAMQMEQNADTKIYMERMNAVKALRDSLSVVNSRLNSARSRLSSVSDPAERESLSEIILGGEMRIPRLQDSLATASALLQQTEMEFLLNGVVLDFDSIQKETDREVVGADKGYTFSRLSLGPEPRLDMDKPKPAFDYTLKILPEGRFAEDNRLPGGIVYQIQMFAISGKANVSQIKGLSPVFEREAGGRHIYSAGLFSSYEDVLANLNKVKSVGFRDAIIVAFKDGDIIPVNRARQLEKEVVTLYDIRIYPLNGATLNDAEKIAIKAVSDKDIVRASEGGVVSFLLGPYERKSEAEADASTLRGAGIANLGVEIKN